MCLDVAAYPEQPNGDSSGVKSQRTQRLTSKQRLEYRMERINRVESLTTYGSRSSNPSTTSAILPAPILANRMGYRGIEEPRGCETKRKASDADLGRRGRGGRWWWRPSWRSSQWSCRWRALGSWARARAPLTLVRALSSIRLLSGLQCYSS